MKYTKNAITQLSRWYKSVLLKCALLNAAILAGAALLATPANAANVAASVASGGTWGVGDTIGTIDLSGYVTTGGLSTALGDYTTTTDLEANYVTNTSLGTTLSGYVTTGSLTTTLGNYLTSSDAASTYATLSGLTTLNGTVTDQGDRITTLEGAGYQTSTQVSSAINTAIGSATFDQTQVTGLTAALNAKANTADLATVATTGAYSDLSGTPTLAAVATSGAYSDLTGTPTLATVATSGAYSDLTGAPDLSVYATSASLATVATTGAYSDLSGTPTLAAVATSGAYSDLTGTPTLAAVATSGAYSDLTGTPDLSVYVTSTALGNKTLDGNFNTLKVNDQDVVTTAIIGTMPSGTYANTGTVGGDLSALDTQVKTNADNIALKANSADVYLKTETYSQGEVDTKLAAKADSAELDDLKAFVGPKPTSGWDVSDTIISRLLDNDTLTDQLDDAINNAGTGLLVRVNGIDTLIGTLPTDSSYTYRSTTVAGYLGNLDQGLTTLVSTVGTLPATTNYRGATTDVTSWVNNIDGQVKTNTDAIADIEPRVTANENNIGDLSALTADAGTATNLVTAINNVDTALTTKITDAITGFEGEDHTWSGNNTFEKKVIFQNGIDVTGKAEVDELDSDKVTTKEVVLNSVSVKYIDDGQNTTAVEQGKKDTLATTATLLKSAEKGQFTSTGSTSLGTAATIETAINTVAGVVDTHTQQIGTVDFSAANNISDTTTDLTSAITQLDTAMGDLSTFAAGNNITTETTLAGAITAIDTVVGNVSTLTGEYLKDSGGTMATNLTDAINNLAANAENAVQEAKDYTDLQVHGGGAGTDVTVGDNADTTTIGKKDTYGNLTGMVVDTTDAANQSVEIAASGAGGNADIMLTSSQIKSTVTTTDTREVGVIIDNDGASTHTVTIGEDGTYTLTVDTDAGTTTIGTGTAGENINIEKGTLTAETSIVAGATDTGVALNSDGTLTAATSATIAGKVVADENGITIDTDKVILGADGTIQTSSDATIGGALNVTGAATLSDTLDVTGDTTLGGTLGVTGDTTLGGTLGVTGATTLNDTLEVVGKTTLSDTNGMAFGTGQTVTSIDAGTDEVTGDGSAEALATTASLMTSAQNAKYDGTQSDADHTYATNGATTIKGAFQAVENFVGDYEALQHNALGINGDDLSVTQAMDRFATNVATAMGGEFAADGSWSAEIENTNTASYGTLEPTDLTNAIATVHSTIGTTDQIEQVSFNGVSKDNTVNDNIAAVNGTVGDIETLNLELANLTNGKDGDDGYNVPETMVDAFNNIDATLGTIHHLSDKLRDEGVYKGNLADGTSVEMHLTSLDSAIGDRATYTNDLGSNGYVTTAGVDVVGAINEIASNIGTADDLGEEMNGVSAGNTVNANIAAVNAALGDVSTLADTHYVSGATNVTDAVKGLDENLYRLDNQVSALERSVDDLRDHFRSGMAGMAAMSALTPNSRSGGDTSLSLGTGAYDGHTAVAFGAFHYINDNFLVNAGASWANDSEVIYRAGVTYSW